MSESAPDPLPGAIHSPGAAPTAAPARQPDSDQPAPDSQERPAPMLDVHPVHATVSGWRDFFIHIVIVAIGLGLAISLQQVVEYLHHRHQIAETRRALQQERAENRHTLASQTRAWRLTVAELQNNLLVFEYLREHPGSPQEKLPGVLVWRVSELSFSRAVWDAARESGVIALMPREEIERYSALYETLDREWGMAYQAVTALIEAERYDLTDADPSHLAAAQIATEIDLIQVALGKQWLQGSQMNNLVEEFPDFPATVTRAELGQLRHRPDEETRKLLAPAEARTMERLKAAGDDKTDSPPPAAPGR
jgi:hypothetical protein